MDAKLRHRGRVITAADITFIRELIAGHPETSVALASYAAILAGPVDFSVPSEPAAARFARPDASHQQAQPPDQGSPRISALEKLSLAAQ